MNVELARYINDHLAGAAGAVNLIADLADRQSDPLDRDFYESLRSKVESDRALLQDLLKRSGEEPGAFLQTVGALTEKVGRIKLLWEGMREGGLGQFEALEMLTLGIQGKRLLWRVLAERALDHPEWDGINFTELEAEARRQREAVEVRRRAAARDCFTRVSAVRSPWPIPPLS